MREIILTSGDKAMVDDEDYNLVVFHDKKYPYQKKNIRVWQLKISDNKKYAVAANWISNKKWTMIRMHRLILGLKNNDKIYVDHIDGNGLNNQRRNLRVANCQQNAQNSRKEKFYNKHSKFKGVCIYRYSNRWRSYIVFNRKQIHLGIFNSEREAAISYNKKALELFGEFACLNKI